MKKKFTSLSIMSSVAAVLVGGAVSVQAATTQATTATGGCIAFEAGAEVTPQPRVAISSDGQEGIWEWTNNLIKLESKVTSLTGSGRASVTAGNTSSVDGGWQKTNVTSIAKTTPSITGTNKVNWDLRP